MAGKTNQADNLCFLRGREFGENTGAPNLDKRLGLFHGIQHGAGNNVVGGNPKTRAGRASNRCRVAGEHAHLNGKVGQGLHGGTGTCLGPVEKAQKAAKYQIVPTRRGRAIRNSEDFDAIRAHVLSNLVGTPTAVGIHGNKPAFKVSPGAARTHAFDLTLYDSQMRTGTDMQP